MTLLPKLLEVDPSLKIIMSSTLTQRNANVSLEALASGAADYIPKPTSRAELHQATDFRRNLISKVKALAAARRGNEPGAATPGGRAPAPARAAVGAGGGDAIKLRKPGLIRPRALAIGSSTGGPKALFKLFESLKNTIRLPIFITQHMPPMFTMILADNLRRVSGAPCAEASDGEEVRDGHIYVAPGDHHMLVMGDAKAKYIRLNQDAPVHYCRPAVDPMFQSVAAAFDGIALGVVLTGMGSDGLNGARVLVQAGGTIIAQDEATSVVWGMPGVVAQGGVCSAVLPLDDIAPAISRLLSGGQA
jgi:two-component system chemotaxis response regulator CheB